MAAEERRFRVVWHRGLVIDDLARVEFVDIEAVPRAVGVDTKSTELARHRAVVPASEDAPSIASKSDDISQLLKFWERFVDLHIMALTAAFYSCCQAPEPCEAVSPYWSPKSNLRISVYQRQRL